MKKLIADGTLPYRTINSRIWIIRKPAIEWLVKQVS